MESSMTKAESLQVKETFKRALDNILARVFVSGQEASSIAVAYSGGLDSSALLHLAREYATSHSIPLFAFHVHHGLSSNADAWLAHCQEVCAQQEITFDARKVLVDKGDGRGIEAAARSVRYRALGEMCREHHVSLLLTAHHLDDQAETVLLQMLRGAGLAGISGMDEVNAAPELLGDPNIVIGRPLLAVRRADLSAFVSGSGISHIEDESNLNTQHPRNALRNDVLPLMSKYFPSYQECLARSAQHAQSAQRLLDELAVQDLATCEDDEGLNAERLKSLSDDRVANLLRHWLVLQGVRPPSTAWLNEALAQLLDAREDAQVCVTLGDIQLRRYRNHVVFTPVRQQPDTAPFDFWWQGEAILPFPAFGGSLHFEIAENGLDPDWLRSELLRMQFRAGGSKLKLAPNRPARDLKDWYQERAIPAWERLRLPLVYMGDVLVFAAGIGQDCRPPAASPGVNLRWSEN
jgi:tRNA(Ile)-lysidine synthase